MLSKIIKFCMNIFEKIFRRKELHYLRIIKKAYDSLIEVIHQGNYVVLSQAEKSIIDWALNHFNFVALVQEPKNTQIRLIWREVREKIKNELARDSKPDKDSAYPQSMGGP